MHVLINFLIDPDDAVFIYLTLEVGFNDAFCAHAESCPGNCVALSFLSRFYV